MESTIATPIFNHITDKDFLNVYEPAEDTFFLLDMLESDLNTIRKLNPIICLEIGCGSGIIITALSHALQTTAFCMATDINPFACKISRQTGKVNKTIVDIMNMNLVDCIGQNQIDLLIFNPPYVITTDEELDDSEKVTVTESELFNKNIIKSWSGGSDGCHVMDRVFVQLPSILSKAGVAYILIIKDNQPELIKKKLERMQLNVAILGDRKIRGEHLYVLKIQK